MINDSTLSVGDVWPWTFVPNCESMDSVFCEYNLSIENVLVEPALSSNQSKFYTIVPDSGDGNPTIEISTATKEDRGTFTLTVDTVIESYNVGDTTVPVVD